MFTLNHFIWLGISLLVVVGMLLLQKFLKLKYNTVLNIFVCVCIASELIKVLSNMQEVGYKGGMVLDPGDLPFHLCSIQIFLVFALKFFVKKEETRQKLLGFMAPTLLIGGVLALVFATVGVKFERPQVYQHFIFHSFIIFFSIYIVKEKFVNWSWKVYAKNLAYLGVYAYVATILNSIIGMGHEKVNFLYIVRPPVEGLPLLNLDNGWYAYFATLVALAIILLAVYHAVVILINKRLLKNAQNKNETTDEALIALQ